MNLVPWNIVSVCTTLSIVWIICWIWGYRLLIELDWKGEFISNYPPTGESVEFYVQNQILFVFFVSSTLHFPRNSSQEPRPTLSNTIQRPQLGPTANLSLEMGSGQLAPRWEMVGKSFIEQWLAWGLAVYVLSHFLFISLFVLSSFPKNVFFFFFFPPDFSLHLPLTYRQQQQQTELDVVPGRDGLASYNHSQVSMSSLMDGEHFLNRCLPEPIRVYVCPYMDFRVIELSC